jgi:hypothetical protein
VFYTTFKFFEQRNYYLRASASFLPSDDCDVHVRHYEQMFRHKNERTLSPPLPTTAYSSTTLDGNETSDSEDGWSDDDGEGPRRQGPPAGHEEEAARDREAAMAAQQRVRDAQARAEEEAAAAAGVAHSAVSPSSTSTSTTSTATGGDVTASLQAPSSPTAADTTSSAIV